MSHRHRYSEWLVDDQDALLFAVPPLVNDLPTPNGRWYRYCLDCDIVTDKFVSEIFQEAGNENTQ